MAASKILTEEEMLRARSEALMHELGPSEYIRYFQQTSLSRNDYTAERQQREPISFAEIEELLARMRAVRSEQPGAG